MINKKLWVFVLAAGLFCLGFWNTHAASDIQPLIEKLENAIAKSGAEVSIVFEDLETGETIEINAEKMMHAASLMKVPVMIEVFRQAEQGKFSLDEKIAVTNEFKSIVDGSPYSLTAAGDSDEDIYRYIGEDMSLRDLVGRMITVSSNLAANLLIERVGVENVMGTLTKLGIHGMKVLRGVEDIKAYEKGLNNRTNATGMALVMQSIALGKVGTGEACGEMIDILSRQKYRAKIPAGIPPGVKVANKTGSITRVDHDGAIVFPEGRKPYILVVMTRGIEKREDAEKLIGELSRLVYDYVTKEEER
jgi:beta-lactamase class A